MIAVVVGAIFTCCAKLQNTNTYTTRLAILLVLLHVIVHAPHSIRYHCNHNEVANNYDIQYIQKDVSFIYISHFLLHIALSIHIPWQISSIMIPAMACVCFTAVEKITSINDIKQVKDAGKYFAWIFLLHYIPIFARQRGMRIIQYHVIVFIPAYLMYKLRVVAKVAKVKNVNIDNAIMHVALIFNNALAFDLVST